MFVLGTNASINTSNVTKLARIHENDLNVLLLGRVVIVKAINGNIVFFYEAPR